MPTKSQIKTDQNIIQFLGKLKIKTPYDLVTLRNLIQNSLEFRPYNRKTKKHADSIQWTRTASEIICDKFVYFGKACSDLAVVFLALCKCAGVNGHFVKLVTLDKKQTHSIVEIKLGKTWYRLDPSSRDSIPFQGQLTKKSIWNKTFQVFKKGHDAWALGFDGIEKEKEIYK